ncbi:flagellar hook-associated protein FlgL [Caldimonas tepidiphila]|uniref:flagellar hook-associated protein FlgL n=1 Tax=Caldimonas tepidiphila TaxID=2315841 RepID=UPI000E5C05A9|nr:flagellar hook-associated protein FlgL [Caldimonas tepidiphila]
MRLSTAHLRELSIGHMQKRQQELAEAQLRLTSGKRVQRASDDPAAAARAERAAATAQRAEVSMRAVEASRNAMAQTDNALGDATALLQSAREALVRAGNAAYNDADRRDIAAHMQQLREQLLSVANRQDGFGQPLFAGQGLQGAPFRQNNDAQPPRVEFTGVAGRGAQLPGATLLPGEGLPGAVDGYDAWMSAPSGNGAFETRAVAGAGTAWIDNGQVAGPLDSGFDRYEIRFTSAQRYEIQRFAADGSAGEPVEGNFVAGQSIAAGGMAVTIGGAPAAGDRFELRPSRPELSVFDALDRAIEGLRKPGAGHATQTVSAGLRDVDAVLGRLLSVRSVVGDTLRRIDGVEERLDGTRLQAQVERSEAEDLDLLRGISDVQQKQNSYETVLKSYAQVSRLSLFQYIA